MTTKAQLATIESTEITATDHLIIDDFSGVDKKVDALLRDANKAQQKINQHSIAALNNAIAAGDYLNQLKYHLPLGRIKAVILGRFCIGNGLSYRTAQRYMLVASNAEKLLVSLRRDRPELNNKSDSEILGSLSINQAITLVRQLFKLDLIEELPIGQTPPKPDANAWFTPEFIVEPIIELCKQIDIDPCAIPGHDPFAAISTISQPQNGLTSEVAWTGRIWINPGLQGMDHSEWAARLIYEFENGNVEEGLILAPACTNAKYTALLRKYPRAFTNAPVDVSGPFLPKSRIKQPLMVVYVGPKERFRDFCNAFNTPRFDVFLFAN